MATINGIEFNLTNIVFDTNNRNVLGRSPGSKTNPISNFGIDGLAISLTGAESTIAAYDAVIAAFMSNGSELIIWSGWKYDIYSTSNNLVERGGFAGKDFPYRFDLICSDPYQHSTSKTTRAKTITANNQEWSADDSANDITTNGSVSVQPNITIAATHDYEPVDDTVYIAAQGSTLSADYVLVRTFTHDAVAGQRHRFISLVGQFASGWFKTTATATSLNGGVEVELLEINYTNSGWATRTQLLDYLNILAGVNEDLVIKLYAKKQSPTIYAYYQTLTSKTALAKVFVSDAEIYNTDVPATTCKICNDIFKKAVVHIASNGTGSFTLAENFDNNDFVYTCININTVYDDINDEFDIADDGYVYYEIDTKYPVTGIPTLTAQINITAGTPTIQISSNGSDWYDIDTAIVDDVDTEYELDNVVSLSLKSKTVFYFRVDCGGVGAVTCSIKSFQLDANIGTIDAENPEINTGAVNTFRCDQDASSSMNCEVSLIYRDRKWAS